MSTIEADAPIAYRPESLFSTMPVDTYRGARRFWRTVIDWTVVGAGAFLGSALAMHTGLVDPGLVLHEAVLYQGAIGGGVMVGFVTASLQANPMEMIARS
ncbi:hypothetical protein HYW42_04565 [Candidatus Daviesbacteria bacterium]|nr:hypothetical protein [Candidatus Daviesbacteria bacterium]